MQAEPIAISANTPGSPASRTKWAVALTSDSEIDASTSMPGQRYRAFDRAVDRSPRQALQDRALEPPAPTLEPPAHLLRTAERYRAPDARLDRPDEQSARARECGP